MDWSQVKDLEVTTDRWAAPVETDDPLMARVRPLLAGAGPRLNLGRAAARALHGPVRPARGPGPGRARPLRGSVQQRRACPRARLRTRAASRRPPRAARRHAA